MSRVMRIGERDDIGARAKQALWEVNRAGQKPLKWTLGREVWNRLRRDCDPGTTVVDAFFGLPFVVKVAAPPDLLEQDAF